MVISIPAKKYYAICNGEIIMEDDSREELGRRILHERFNLPVLIKKNEKILADTKNPNLVKEIGIKKIKIDHI